MLRDLILDSEDKLMHNPALDKLLQEKGTGRGRRVHSSDHVHEGQHGRRALPQDGGHQDVLQLRGPLHGA